MKKNNLHSQGTFQYQWLILFAMTYLIGWTTTYPMIYKMVEINGILEPGCIFLFPLSYAIADVITEVYGYKIARQIIWSALIAGCIFCIALKFVSALPPPAFWKKQNSYEIVFSHILRAYFATTIASLAGSFANIYIISRWKILMYGKYFWFRSLFSTGIGELFFSVIGGTLAYSGIEPWSKIVFLMLDGYLFKMIYAFIAVCPATLLVFCLKRAENIDIYDTNINYNPLSFSVN